MRNSSLLTPITVIIAGCVLIVLLFAQPNNSVAQIDPEIYPPPTQTALAAQTATALVLTPTDPAYPGDETTTSTTVTPNRTATTTRTTTGTAVTGTRTPVVTPGSTTFASEPTAQTNTEQSTPTSTATDEPAETPTPTVDENTRICTPGETVALNGRGPANAGFLVYFNQRIVSGGTVRRDGTFDVGITVGNEREGSYPVEVRVRGTRTVLAEFTCQVPATTPTPLPVRTGS